MYLAAVVLMSTLARVRMEFNCYDVLEVHGSRYVITEKIKYIEIIPKADKEQSYRGQPSMTKSPGDYWHEYGLEAVEGTDKIWVTIEYNDNEWCTVSRTSYRKRAPKGFTLHQIGLEKVVDVDGDSGASVGDRAGYKLVNIKLCNDAAANAVRKKKRNQHLKKRLEGFAIAIGCGALFWMFLVSGDSDFSWHGIRGTFGFPYTAKEHMHDTSVYYTKTDSDNEYTSSLDPVSTALELIDSLNGDIKNEGESLAEGREVIVFYDAKSAYIITNVDGQTRVKVCEPGKLTPEEQELINSTIRKTHVLDSYAYMVRQRDSSGREKFLNIHNLNEADKAYMFNR